MSDRAHPRGLVTLVPRSGIQFLDLDLAIEALPRTPSVFWEEMLPGTAVEPGKSPVVLRVLEPDADGALSDPVTRQTPPENETYAIGRAQALEPFLRRWVPLPMFRVKGRGADGRVELDRGPTNWVRAHVAPAPEGARD
ncbi:MAG: virulence factor SrfB, partial [Acetobacteraceae bacterium]